MLQQIKLLLLSIITLCRRLCCFSRRRKMSYDGRGATAAGDQAPLEAVNVIVERNYGSGKGGGGAERDWNSWDTTPRTVEEHIEQYRQRMAQPPTPPKEEPEPDFFSELAPTIKPQLKYYLDTSASAGSSNKPTDFSRLQAQDVVPISDNADLEDWVDESNGAAGGWEELDTSQTKQIIREKRRELRNQRPPPSKPSQQGGIGAQRLSGVGGRVA
ncbi:uncharacterized protein Dwil_GK25204 [Drosophila willistoni]|uniref:Receptor-binding cancer antigen expressed on SiSo cells n=1 Tax=Drosophila willistoni TaxID=7260 RepID=B4NEW4_DROWI|nr:receptor-binding cancer antigen expressed on SiSo cells [Drosophila willistoni]EDW82283.1 uncharacterized protein Dwil_GK25204 [Drosophila willistoni]